MEQKQNDYFKKQQELFQNPLLESNRCYAASCNPHFAGKNTVFLEFIGLIMQNATFLIPQLLLENMTDFLLATAT